jgi:uncharacterized damage-inducible protein DinB
MERKVDKTYFIGLVDYNYWANRKVWDCVMRLSDEQFTQDLDYSIGSIFVQCVHTMGVESWWFTFLQTGKLEFLELEDFPNRAAIRTKWDEVETMARAYAASLTPSELEREVTPDFWENKPAIKVWEAILQITNHSTDHRAQMLAGLHRLGAPTISQDVLDYIFEKRKIITP